MANKLKTPKVMPSEFCADGDKNTILTSPSTSNPQLANFSTGFPAITQTPIPNGGIPPERADFNGMFNLLSSALVYIQNGGQWTFVPEVSNAIGGYPAGAILNYYDAKHKVNRRVVSNINNNVNNFLLDPSQIGDSSKPWSYTENTPIVQDLKNPSTNTVPSTKAVSDDSRRLESVMDTKVNKTGNETISGLKKFTERIHVINNSLSGIILEVPGVQWASLNVQAQNSAGAFLTTGNFSNYIPLFLGSSNKINSAVTTTAIGPNYVRLGNGLQICWGNSAVGQTITLPQPFKDANYKITFCQTDGGEHNINQVVTDKKTTSFRFSRGYTADWIAIGYWY